MILLKRVEGWSSEGGWRKGVGGRKGEEPGREKEGRSEGKEKRCFGALTYFLDTGVGWDGTAGGWMIERTKSSFFFSFFFGNGLTFYLPPFLSFLL